MTLPRNAVLIAARLACAALAPFIFACTGTPQTTYVTASAAPPSRTITVSGAARVELVPDEACVELTLAARDPTMEAAHAQLVRDVDALLAALDDDSALTIERGAIRYTPDYQSDDLGRGTGRTRLVGYVATAQVNVRTRDFVRIPDVVGVAATRGLDRVDVVFYATDMVERKAEVRQHALEAARDKARAMADVLDVELGEVITITEGGATTNGRVEINNYVASATTDALPNTPPTPGAIPLTLDVGVVYALSSGS